LKSSSLIRRLLKTMAWRSIETMRSTNPATQLHIPEQPNAQHHYCSHIESRKCVFILVYTTWHKYKHTVLSLLYIAFLHSTLIYCSKPSCWAKEKFVKLVCRAPKIKFTHKNMNQTNRKNVETWGKSVKRTAETINDNLCM
jgi:hypothetical protein